MRRGDWGWRIEAEPRYDAQVRKRWALVLLLAWGACKRPPADAAETPAKGGARTAHVFFLTGLLGHVEPCGCTSEPLGGLPRILGHLEAFRAPYVLLDSGHMLFPDAPADALTQDQHRLKAKLIAQMATRLSLGALNFSDNDLREGASFLSELQRGGALPWVSAHHTASRKGPDVARSFVRTVGGVRIGITGVTASEDPKVLAAHLQKELKALRDASVEFVVVLANLPFSSARDLLGAVPGIDVMLWGPGAELPHPPSAPIRVGDGLLAEAGRQGQYLGHLEIRLGAARAPGPIPFDDRADRAARRRKLLERKAAAFRQEIDTLKGQGASDASLAPRRARLASVTEALQALKDAPLPAPPAGPYVRMEAVKLGADRPVSPVAQAALTDYYARLRKLNMSKFDPKPCELESSGARFVGNEKCAGCHAPALAFWKTTKHAQAWATLERQGKQADLTCVGCHVVGFRQPGGVCGLKDLDGFVNVGCESCHGPGEKHAAQPVEGSMGKVVPASVCADGCHVPEHSDRFNFDTYRARIIGPGHGAPAAGAPSP